MSAPVNGKAGEILKLVFLTAPRRVLISVSTAVVLGAVSWSEKPQISNCGSKN